ncbi:hypothetical protein RFI_03678 [Reticulomyxa filosa]|uniref:Uncharacterized protein n=1 Tax=Reticulomyxa filosa TaxID=46433 RepID=X6P5N9_RETFI|nr:hypothetical protein RFI_03678 [Reticulomyxa filosa]|eukprot:ETO33428.1 hypothetical protein RFI_03678 [Reticulomyxa filosa]
MRSGNLTKSKAMSVKSGASKGLSNTTKNVKSSNLTAMQTKKDQKSESKNNSNSRSSTILSNRAPSTKVLSQPPANGIKKAPIGHKQSTPQEEQAKIVPFVGDKVRLKNKTEGKITHIGPKQKCDGVWVRLEVISNIATKTALSKDNAVWISAASIEKVIQRMSCLFHHLSVAIFTHAQVVVHSKKKTIPKGE